MEMSGVPLVAGPRGTKTEALLWNFGGENAVRLSVPPSPPPHASVNNIEVNITVTPKLLPPAQRHQTGSATPPTGGAERSRPGWGGGSVLPSASCLRSSGSRAGAPPQRSTSSHTPSHPPQAAPAGPANHGPQFQNVGGGDGEGAGPAIAPPCCRPCFPPPAPTVPQSFDTLAGRCNSHISGNLLPVCWGFFLNFFFFFFEMCDLLFVSVLFCGRCGCANAGC